jgi:predicted nucleic-acid-binding protein
MIGLDTNVILRYIVDDDEVQSAMATRQFEALTPDNPGFISLVALVETVWVLRSIYECTRTQIQRVIETLLRTRGVFVEQSDLVWMSLATYSRGNADFGDCIIESVGRAAGCDYTLTFDRDSARTAGMILLK